MIKRLLLTTVLAFPLVLTQAMMAQQGASIEETKTRPDKKEIIDLMIKSARLSAQQQNEKLGLVFKNQSDSKTPRSDFLFCIGLAYLGNVKAQKCVAKAYESGFGIIEDTIETYVWYEIAISGEPQLESERDRVKTKLQAAYPFPSDDDLADQVNAQKERIKQYQAETRKEKK